MNNKFQMFVDVFYDNVGSRSFLDNIDDTVVEIPIVEEIMKDDSPKTVKKLKKI